MVHTQTKPRLNSTVNLLDPPSSRNLSRQQNYMMSIVKNQVSSAAPSQKAVAFSSHDYEDRTFVLSNQTNRTRQVMNSRLLASQNSKPTNDDTSTFITGAKSNFNQNKRKTVTTADSSRFPSIKGNVSAALSKRNTVRNRNTVSMMPSSVIETQSQGITKLTMD
jgi:hypothetical protein